MFRIIFSIFVAGLVLGSGPCLATCGPILISYIAGTKKTPLGGLWCWLVFSVTRVLVYGILGALAGALGNVLFQAYYWEFSGFIIWLFGGAFISFLGILIILGKDIHFRFCQKLDNIFIKKDTKSLIVLGIFIGLFPCAPLIGVVSYIAMISIYMHQGLILGLAFGLGTIISPLVFLAIGTGFLPKLRVLQNEKNIIVFQRIAGGALLLLGIHILVKTIFSYFKAL